jgi:hypothetical protein
VPAYANGKIYPNTKHPNRRDCGKQSGLLSRIATWVGLESVVHAQGGCNDPTCDACYRKLTTAFCPGSCDDEQYYVAIGGGLCLTGQNLEGPACGLDDGCYCNEGVCTNTPQNCGCS